MKFTATQLTRCALVSLRRKLPEAPISFVDLPDDDAIYTEFKGYRLYQRGVDEVIAPAAFDADLDTFNELFIDHMTSNLARFLTENGGVDKTYPLRLPNNIPCARERYDGLSMRGIIAHEPGFSDGTRPAMKVLRFDVLYSPELDPDVLPI